MRFLSIGHGNENFGDRLHPQLRGTMIGPRFVRRRSLGEGFSKSKRNISEGQHVITLKRGRIIMDLVSPGGYSNQHNKVRVTIRIFWFFPNKLVDPPNPKIKMSHTFKLDTIVAMKNKTK